MAGVARRERRTQQERRDQTAAAVLVAAAELIVETGVRSLTLAGVGERAGYSRAIVNHRFGTKQALVDALARRLQAGFVAGLDDVAPGFDRLVQLIEGYVVALGQDSVATHAFLVLWAESSTSPELAAIMAERDRHFRAGLRADVAAGIADGSVRIDADPDVVAAAVVGQLRGIGLQRLVDPAAVDTVRMAPIVAEMWKRALCAASWS